VASFSLIRVLHEQFRWHVERVTERQRASFL
jgi:hypothetical protein